jgi:hypothetical protein
LVVEKVVRADQFDAEFVDELAHLRVGPQGQDGAVLTRPALAGIPIDGTVPVEVARRFRKLA